MPSASSINVFMVSERRGRSAARVAPGRHRSTGKVVRNALRHLLAADALSPAKKPKLSKATSG